MTSGSIYFLRYNQRYLDSLFHQEWIFLHSIQLLYFTAVGSNE